MLRHVLCILAVLALCFVPHANAACSTIADAAASAQLTALSSALEFTGLLDVFNVTDDTNAYTLCAPTNAAFAALSAQVGGLENLSTSQLAQVKQILLAHAVSGSFSGATLAAKKPSNVPTLAAGILLSTDGVTVTLGGNIANIVKPDAAINLCGGSIVHIVDAVMLPPDFSLDAPPGPPSPPGECMTIAQAAAEANLTALTTAIQMAQLSDVYDVAGATATYTVCAPTNEAFASLAAAVGGYDNLSADQLGQLKEILLAHAVEGAFDAETLAAKKPSNVPTLADGVLLATDGVTVTLGANIANIVKGNAAVDLCGGSIVHIIDAVMLPPNITLGMTSTTPTSMPPSSKAPSPPSTSPMPPGASPSPPTTSSTSSASRGTMAWASAAFATLSVLLLATGY